MYFVGGAQLKFIMHDNSSTQQPAMITCTQVEEYTTGLSEETEGLTLISKAGGLHGAGLGPQNLCRVFNFCLISQCKIG